jgi:putative ABC transport system ATP-binding protein
MARINANKGKENGKRMGMETAGRSATTLLNSARTADRRVAVRTASLTKEYPLGKTKVAALKGVSVSIASGAFVTIAGPSGSGKSTLLSLIGCLDRPTAGEVWVAGRRTDGLGERDLNRLRLRTIGFVFQAFNLIPVLTVYENIELPLLILPEVSAAERRERVTRLIAETGLEGQVRQRPAELSGGQQQRVAVARALVTRPAIVLADEPTANLDSATGLALIDLMHRSNRKDGTTFIFSSHDPKIIDRADTVIRLADGLVSGGPDGGGL